MQILAVTGTNGGGKGTLVRFLEEEGYKHLSARDLLLEEISKRNLSDDRNAMNHIGNTLRQENGPDYVARELLRRAIDSGAEKIIIESIRCPGEVHFLREHEVLLLAVDDPVEVRYERILKRKNSTDKVTLDEFIQQEQKESVGTEEWDMNIPACIREADFVFSENGDIEMFRKKVHTWAEEYLK
jgi:dephospho-CoA kinase